MRNWADPSGYGVPGKPITQDQFFTEDVFYMLVPDSGRSPTSAVAEKPYKIPRWLEKRAEELQPNLDPGMIVDAPRDIDPGILITPYAP